MDTEAVCTKIDDVSAQRYFVESMIPIVIINKYLEHHIFANQNENGVFDEIKKSFKMFELALGNTKDENNVQFDFGCGKVNKYVQVHKQLMLCELKNKFSKFYYNMMKMHNVVKIINTNK